MPIVFQTHLANILHPLLCHPADWDAEGFEGNRGVLLDPAPWPEPQPELAMGPEPFVGPEPRPGGPDVVPRPEE